MMTGLTGAAAMEAVRLGAAVLGEKGDGERGEEFEFTDDTVATGERAAAAGVLADGKLVEADGVTAFEDFGVGDGGVGHVAVLGAGTGVGWAGAGAAADGFVVAKAVVAEEEVVHGALAGGLQLERFEEGVDNALADFNIAADNGGKGLRVES